MANWSRWRWIGDGSFSRRWIAARRFDRRCRLRFLLRRLTYAPAALHVLRTHEHWLRSICGNFRIIRGDDWRRFKLRNLETNFLRQCICKHVDAAVDRFSETTVAEWSSHAITHLADDAFGQTRLHRAADLRERRFRRDRNNEQHALGPTCLRAYVPIGSKLFGKVRKPLRARVVNDRDVQFDFALILQIFQQALNSVLRFSIDNAGKIADVSARRSQFGRLRERVRSDQEKQTGGRNQRQQARYKSICWDHVG